MKTIQKNSSKNAGFTLMELVIVMAIIVVTVTFFITGITTLFNLPSRQCSRQLKAALEKMRIDTMGRNGAGLKIYRKNGEIFVEELVSDEDGAIVPNPAKKIGNKRVSFEVVDESGAKRDLDEGGVTLAFKRDTGGMHTSGTVGSASIIYVPEFRISSGRKSYKISVGKLTGAIDLKDVSGKDGE